MFPTRFKKPVIALAVAVLMLSIGVVSSGYAETLACGPFVDIPTGAWYCANVLRIKNLNITTGTTPTTYEPGNFVTRQQMAAFLDRLTNSWTTANEPYLFNLDHQGTGSAPAIRARSKGGNAIAGFSYGGAIADNGLYGETNSTYQYEAGVRGASTSNATGVIGVSSGGWGGYLQGSTEWVPDLVLGGVNVSNDNGVISSHPALNGSDVILFSYDEAHIHLDENNDESGNFVIYAGNNEPELRIDEAGNWYGAWGASNSDNHLRFRDDLYIHLDQTADDGNPGWFVIQNANGAYAFSVEENGNTSVHGNLYVSGTKSAVTETSAGPRKVYSIESPEVWLEDFGTGQLGDGQAVVSIEPLFLETINTGEDYYVFLTPLGDCNGLYVASKSATSFEVRELGGGTTDISFDYRIVAKRLGYEELRLEEMLLDTEVFEPGPAMTEVDEAPLMNQPVIVEINESEE
ncbi:MAG: S-layer homology domain-containing protein [Chloroflexi bacterium]|nr:S-layer homology domain-containing protein [Chloroflexota bacterium]